MNKYQEEYLGKQLEVIETNNKQLLGIQGMVIKETKNTFIIENSKKTTILKSNNTFRINGKKINGDKIAKKPEERIKIR
jgi:ribonuclease P protein subunit POP4